MGEQTVLYEVIDQVALLTLNRPEKLNALTEPMLAEFWQGVQQAGTDPTVRAIVIRGAGRAFCVGYDLGRESQTQRLERTVMQDWLTFEGHLQLWLRVLDFPKPVIASVHGHCLAAGLDLVTCCDLTIVSDDAEFGGATISSGAGVHESMLPLFIGIKKTKELSMVSGLRFSGAEAVALGLANRVYPRDALHVETMALAHRIARLPSDILQLKKTTINRILYGLGFREAVLRSADMNVVGHSVPGGHELRKLIRDVGLKEAIRLVNGA